MLQHPYALVGLVGLLFLYSLFSKKHIEDAVKVSSSGSSSRSGGGGKSEDIGSGGVSRYGIMIDAGSTGSRVHVYEFSSHSNGALKLDDELFVQVKPGLSSFKDDADIDSSVANSLQPLVDQAQSRVPRDLWQSTPIYMFATAGLRLLDEDKQQVRSSSFCSRCRF